MIVGDVHSETLNACQKQAPDCRKMLRKIMSLYLILVVVMVTELANVAGHGYICDPPGRSSMWRKECGGFSTPTNVNDMGLNCGGLEVKHNGSKIVANIFFNKRKIKFR